MSIRPCQLLQKILSIVVSNVDESGKDRGSINIPDRPQLQEDRQSVNGRGGGCFGGKIRQFKRKCVTCQDCTKDTRNTDGVLQD